MTAPVWVTPPGNLGTIVEAEFYQIQLAATDASSYEYLSGILPSGIRITTNGIVEGMPRNYDYIQGVPQEVAQDVTSKFVVRAVSLDGKVADRVFEMTVTGQDAPIIDTLPTSTLDSYFDGENVSIQLTAFDPDPADTLSWSVQSGEVPNGLTLSASGLLSGWLLPVPTLTGTPGFDINKFDIGNFDFSTISVSKNYQFTIEVTDGKDVANKTYTMFIASRNLVSADSTDVIADSFAPTAASTNINSKLTADLTTKRTPYLVTKAVDLGTIKHDNYFNFQFTGYDFDGERLEYSISTGDALGYDSDSAVFDAFGFDRGKQELPPGLVLNTLSGWMYGYIPIQLTTTKDYKFAIQVYKKNYPTYKSDWTNFTLKVEGDIDSSITWPAADLSSIETGQVSELDIIATIASGRSVQYSLKSGADLGSLGKGELPQGLKINTSGLIIGRVSFETFMLDTGTTTFDYDSVRLNETTFERTYKFSVRALSSDGVIDTYKQFTLKVVPKIFKPYESVYVRALPSQSQRDIYESLINNTDDIAPENIYRLTDSNFGVQKTVRALVASGLNPVTETTLVEATVQNHWNNVLGFGDIKIAKAYNNDGTEKYDIVYIELVDKIMGKNPTTGVAEPAAQRINLKVQKSITQMTSWSNPISMDASWPKVSSGNYAADANNDHYVYPNAIQNMRNQLTTKVGTAILERFVLPDWMKDKQAGGSVLGWTLAAPIVYCKPGTGSKIAYLLEQRTLNLKKISFEVDRYILDNNLSQFYNKATGKWTSTSETTFDVYNNVGVSNEAATTFDGNGTRFFASVDTFIELDAGDKYIKFPKVGVFR